MTNGTRNPGPTAGSRKVREVGPRGKRVRMENYDHAGRVRIVHPEVPARDHYPFNVHGKLVEVFK